MNNHPGYPIEVLRRGEWVPGKIVGTEVEDGRAVLDIELAYPDQGGHTKVWVGHTSKTYRNRSPA